MCDRRLTRRRVLQIASVLLAGLAGSFAVWDPLEIDARATVERLTDHALNSVRSVVIAELRARLGAQQRLATLLAAREPLSDSDWDLSSKVFLDGSHGQVLLEWVDGGFTHPRAASNDGRRQSLVRAFASIPAVRSVLQNTLAAGSGAMFSPVFDAGDGRKALAIAARVQSQDAAPALIVTVIDIEMAIAEALEAHGELGYAVVLLEGGQILHQNRLATQEPENRFIKTEDLRIAGLDWTIRVWPTESVLRGAVSALPELAAVLGALLGVMLMLTFESARGARRVAGELREAQNTLEVRIRERTEELQRSNDTLHDEIVERQKAQEQCQRLSGRLLQLQDEERRRIARELHDSTAQILFLAAASLEQARAVAEQRGCGVTAILRDAGESLERAAQEIRTVSYLLHPPILDDLGLTYTLTWYADGLSKRAGIAVRLDLQPVLGRLPRDVELTIFRITQEALSNVHRHSGSDTASIWLTRTAESIILEIKDRGRGMPPDVLQGVNGSMTSLGIGIAGMRERVRQLGGQLEIASGPGGTTVRTVLPLPVGAQGAGAESTL